MTTLIKPTAQHLMHTPLGELLSKCNAQVAEVPITDPEWYGAAVLCDDGAIGIAVSPLYAGAVRDAVVRIVLAQVLGVDVAPPDCLRLHVIYPTGTDE